MATTKILLRPIFWIAFVGLMIFCLFIYGLKINKEKTELQEARLMLAEKNQQLSDCSGESEILRNKLNELELKITEQSNAIIENGKKLSALQAFSSGYGKLTIYSECTNCSPISVTIDDEYWGTLNSYFTSEPFCGQDGAITKFIPVGKHRIRGSDRRWSWEFYVTIEENICTVSHFSD